MTISHNQSVTASEGKLLALLTVCFYVFFTLIPDSHSVIVAWPWVLFWQVGLFCPVLSLLGLLWLGKVSWLGHGWDWLVGITIVGLIVSTSLAQFRQQGIWYSWWVICMLAALYTLNTWLNTPQRRYQILVKQGYLNLAFIVLSLILWTSQTWLPELSRIKQLNASGFNLVYDFSVIELRNWAPLGHQNYVAGYLLLALPLLIGLAIVQTGWRRWLWSIGGVLGLVDLYTTSSRGGWLAIIVVCLVGIVVLACFSSLPRLWLAIGSISIFTVLGCLIVVNNRLYNLIVAIANGQGGGELAYRLINATIGWRMGITHLWTGVGLGGVPLLYQKYRPVWAGRESELAFQLHSTPCQLWAEMGIWAVISGLGAIALLSLGFWRWLTDRTKIKKRDRVLGWCIYASFLGYGVMCLTDYQLDNICISGTLILFLAWKTAILRDQEQLLPHNRTKPLALAVGGVVLAMIIWLFPVHRAWQLSSQGFFALAQDKIDTFTTYLSQAHRLAPWESYYSYQLGWNLGNLAQATNEPQSKQQLVTEAISWFERGIEASPNREFGHSNLGWLLLSSNPQAATSAFARSAQLVPAKRGVFYGLGMSLLAQNQVNLAVEALTLEALRNPLFISSPVWRSPTLLPLQAQFYQNLAAKYQELLQQQPNNSYWHLSRGSLWWWLGEEEAARRDWEAYGNSFHKLMLRITTESELSAQITQLPSSRVQLLITAWFKPERRSELLQKAWLQANQTPIPPQLLKQLLTTMNNSSSFEQWLKHHNPVFPYRHERSGFGVANRHIDGAIPVDFLVVMENLAIATWFGQLFPSPTYAPEVDQVLQPYRDTLLGSLRSPAIDVRKFDAW